jgi:uncharacterized membrane protein
MRCPKLVEMKIELARAQKRKELEAKIDQSKEKLEHVTVIENADPGSAAIKTYLEALGVSISTSIISQWLNLVPVLALELGSALAAVLVSNVSGKAEASRETKPATETASKTEPQRPASTFDMPQLATQARGAVEMPLDAFLAHQSQAYQPVPQPMPQRQPIAAMPQMQTQSQMQGASIYAFPVDRAHSRLEAEGKIVEALKLHNGSSAQLAYSERQLANYLGLDKSTVWRASVNLEKKGVIKRVSAGNRCILTLVQ